jgi:hypothetical protein
MLVVDTILPENALDHCSFNLFYTVLFSVFLVILVYFIYYFSQLANTRYSYLKSKIAPKHTLVNSNKEIFRPYPIGSVWDRYSYFKTSYTYLWLAFLRDDDDAKASKIQAAAAMDSLCEFPF